MFRIKYEKKLFFLELVKIQEIDIDINSPAVGDSELYFLYVVANKGLEVKNEIDEHRN